MGEVISDCCLISVPTHIVKHFDNTPMHYTAIFHGCINDNSRMKKVIFVLILARNIDCGNTLEPVRWF